MHNIEYGKPTRRFVLAGLATSLFVKAEAFMQNINVVELRQYTLHKDQRDVLIRLFHEHFVSPQNALGAHVLGTFTDRDDPDRFVWFRGFESMDSRKQALEAFYTGDVWRAHRNAANATMLDSDNVLLLRPAAKPDRPLDSAPFVDVFVHNLKSVAPERFAAWFFDKGRRHFEAAGLKMDGAFVSETEANSWPRLPVRTGESVFVWWSSFADAAAEASWPERLRALSGWRDGIDEALLPALASKPEIIRLRRV